MTTIQNVRVFDGEKLTSPSNMVIDNGFIKSVSPGVSVGSDVIDGAGKTLLAGFIGTHMHIDNRDNCVLAAEYGVTTLIDQMCKDTALIDSLRDPDEPIASVRSVYMPVESQAGPMMVKALGYAPDFAATKEDVHRIIDEQIAKGAFFIKLILDVPPLTTGMLSEELVAEAVRYAHEKGKKISAHCTTVEAYERAAKCGVDILNHIPKDVVLPQQIIDEIKAKGLVVIPTMVMQEGLVNSLKKVMPERAGDFSVVVTTVRAMHDAGIKILVGTDSNNTNALCHIKHGQSLHREFALLKEAGLSNVEILRGTTVDAAQFFGLTDRGSIEPGKRADLVLVEGDPTQDISAADKIDSVWVKGKKAL